MSGVKTRRLKANDFFYNFGLLWRPRPSPGSLLRSQFPFLVICGISGVV